MLSRYKKYDETFVSENLMGPNIVKITEELTNAMTLRSCARYCSSRGSPF